MARANLDRRISAQTTINKWIATNPQARTPAFYRDPELSPVSLIHLPLPKPIASPANSSSRYLLPLIEFALHDYSGARETLPYRALSVLCCSRSTLELTGTLEQLIRVSETVSQNIRSLTGTTLSCRILTFAQVSHSQRVLLKARRACSIISRTSCNGKNIRANQIQSFASCPKWSSGIDKQPPLVEVHSSDPAHATFHAECKQR